MRFSCSACTPQPATAPPGRTPPGGPESGQQATHMRKHMHARAHTRAPTSRRPISSGTPMSISRSKRPKRRSAASMELGRLVAAMTMTCARLLRPSMSVSSWDTMRRSTCARVGTRVGVCCLRACASSRACGATRANARRGPPASAPHAHLALRLLALGRDGVHLVDEDDGRRVLLRLLEHLRTARGGERDTMRVGACGHTPTRRALAAATPALRAARTATATATHACARPTLRRLDSDSPASLLMISGPLTMTKNAPVSLATARAMSVLPEPGGPYSRMPCGVVVMRSEG